MGKRMSIHHKKVAEINKYHHMPLYMEKQSLPCHKQALLTSFFISLNPQHVFFFQS